MHISKFFVPLHSIFSKSVGFEPDLTKRTFACPAIYIFNLLIIFLTMNEIQNLNSESDLHICSHLEPESLPPMIQPLLKLAQSPAEQDMLLLSLLTAAGSCMPNLYCRYGIAAKRYYPNLQLFIVGSAACGKGIANLALDLVRLVHAATPLIIPGDATYPVFYQTLARQHGRGYIHESEGSVITDIWRSSTANYNTALRKAAEHETISRARCKEYSVIENPQLSMVLTGTFSQYHALVPSIIRDKSHPRYMEFYRLWREHVQTTDHPMQFPNFVRHVLSQAGE